MSLKWASFAHTNEIEENYLRKAFKVIDNKILWIDVKTTFGFNLRKKSKP